VTYTELVTAVQDYLETTFTTADIDTMIRQAEQRIYNTVQVSYFRKNMTGVTVASNQYLSAPPDFLSAYSLAIIDANNEYHYLLNKDVNFIREAYPVPTGSGNTGRPRHYAIFGPTVTSGVISNNLSFILGPTPDAIYGVELHYYYYPESIVDANTSWLGENFDSVLLNATLYEGSTFLKLEQDLVALAKDRYVQSIALLKNLGDGKQRMDAYRDGQVRVQVS
jgi:hypothetical protein